MTELVATEELLKIELELELELLAGAEELREDAALLVEDIDGGYCVSLPVEPPPPPQLLKTTIKKNAVENVGQNPLYKNISKPLRG